MARRRGPNFRAFDGPLARDPVFQRNRANRANYQYANPTRFGPGQGRVAIPATSQGVRAGGPTAYTGRPVATLTRTAIPGQIALPQGTGQKPFVTGSGGGTKISVKASSGSSTRARAA